MMITLHLMIENVLLVALTSPVIPRVDDHVTVPGIDRDASHTAFLVKHVEYTFDHRETLESVDVHVQRLL
jgi:hypothetical protein